MIAYSAPLLGFFAGQPLHDNGDGTVSVQKPNGKWLCVTPNGTMEERDSPGGLWESFRRAKNGTLLAERDGGALGPLVYPILLVE